MCSSITTRSNRRLRFGIFRPCSSRADFFSQTIGCRMCRKSRCAQWDTHSCATARAVTGGTMFSGGSGNDATSKSATAREQKKAPRQKLAIERRGSDKSFHVFRILLSVVPDWKRQIRRQGFVITVSWPYSRANGGEPKTCSQRVSTSDRIGALLSTTNAASRSRLGSRHGTSSGYTRYGVSNTSLETASVSPLSNNNG